jgi:hypothetical protein
MEDILKRGRESFYKTMQSQNIEWNLIDSGVVQEDFHKPLPPKKEKELKEKVKSRQYI